MARPTRSTPNADATDPPDPSEPGAASSIVAFFSGRTTEPDLATLPIAGITRRRMAIVLGALLAAWILVVFARQVSEASAATNRAEAMVVANAERRVEIDGMKRELAQIQQLPYVLQQARAHGLGGPHEIPFSLAADAPSLAPDAPGSASVRLGAADSVSPLERWLSILFGSSD